MSGLGSSAGSRFKFGCLRILVLTCLVGIMIPIFSIAFANSSGSTVPLLLRSKYLNALRRTDSSLANPVAFYESLAFKVFSKLNKIDALEANRISKREESSNPINLHHQWANRQASIKLHRQKPTYLYLRLSMLFVFCVEKFNCD